jgi:hypothetical protein
MINFHLARIAMTTAILIMLGSLVPVPVMARPIDSDPPVATRKIIFPGSSLNCPLRRIDRQLIRCDNLTGAGVPAPLFIPEL